VARKNKINGYILYRGPSKIDGEPIIMIGTGFAEASDNTKTGKGMIQTWILTDDIHPNNAVNDGDDYSICGDCVHRGRLIWDKEKLKRRVTGRTCYVKVFQAPSNVWKAYKRGLYPEISAYDIPEIMQNRAVRFGAYGDPAAVPYEVINAIGLTASFTTGYTHQWKNCEGRYRKWVMASAESNEERIDAKTLGYRVFRVRADFDDVNKFEIKCPAAKEMGHKTTCDKCKACGGLSSKANADITIMAHGDAVKQWHFKKMIEKQAA
jgi:hypothetical protein